MKAWNGNRKTKNLSEFVTDSMEAFMVVAYDNSYNLWMDKYGRKFTKDNGDNNNNGEELSCISENTTISTYKYIEGTNGSGRSRGWTEKAFETYNRIIEVIKQQKIIYGEEYEDNIRNSMVEDKQKNRRRKNHVVPKNDINKLMKIIDI